MKKKYSKWIWLIVLTAWIVPSVALAAGGETDPRDKVPAPGGLKGIVFYYRNTSAYERYLHGASAGKNEDMESSIAIFRYFHYFSYNKWTFAVNFLQPFGTLHYKNTSGSVDERSSGLGDITGSITVWYPLSLEKDNMLWLSGAYYLTAPIGEYTQSKVINLGENRWNNRFMLSPVWKHGPFVLEVAGCLDLYTDNNKYTPADLKLEQDPVWTTTVHLSYDITNTFWIGGSYFYHTGGKTSYNGVKNDDAINTHKLLFSACLMTTPQTQLLIQYARDISVQNGFATHAIQARFVYFW
jgi:hypothetical protein